MDARCRVRPADARDLAAIAEIERVSFSDPWSPAQLASSLAVVATFLVAMLDGELAGYVIAQHAADQAEILNLGVAPAARRRGVGRALVRAAVARLRALAVRSIHLEVRESNRAAQQLYESERFVAVGRRRRYYRRPEEDAVVLRAVILSDGGDA